ncbi:uncharacterized protein LOC125202122 isoform X2 [Salvia hispanica]|uniref:uncharacterized protein LOC125202122 isoform X2 n=1 Tax=Salvia hispanica TaxID=49212 RepID=UPI002009A8A1|nr:uncharacterized protein LOC125202122 isoform X2 [Salvia hispanica]
MQTVTTVVNCSSFSPNLCLKIKNFKPQSFSTSSKILNCEIPHSPSPPHLLGLCRASQVAELFPTMSPEIVVREARIEDCWEVAETHCSCFFPEYSFPLDFVLRFDRLVGMLFGFSVPKGCERTCLVAVIGSGEDEFYIGSDDFKIGGLEGKISLNKGRGVAYISNVAVREKFRRKGIAKRLIAKAEAKAKTWGCRAIALHCDLSNPEATRLYTSQGFKIIKIPDGANWPHPRLSGDVKFNFMMKLL